MVVALRWLLFGVLMVAGAPLGEQAARLPNVTSILVAVVSAPSHFHARDAIRATWLQQLNLRAPQFASVGIRIETKFFIGTPKDASLAPLLLNETSLVRQWDVLESYQNLSRKTLGMVGWAASNEFDVVLKVDDDTFLHVDNLLAFLSRTGISHDIYAGHFQSKGIVIDNPKSKWFMRDQFDSEIYPAYAFGPCYLLGPDMVKYLSSNRNELFPYRVEDAGVAIWTEPLQLNYVDMPCYYYHAECQDASKAAVFVNPVSADEMVILQRNAERGDMCKSPTGDFQLRECTENRCRCWPTPETSCYDAFANAEYEDVIPRL